MNDNYKYSLAKKGKTICPNCKHRTFVLYVDNETGQPLNNNVGRCDREEKCQYHYTPSQYFKDNGLLFDTKPYERIRHTPVAKMEPPPSYIDINLMQRSFNYYDTNNLIVWLRQLVGDAATVEAINRYCIGSTKKNQTVFWQIDTHGKVHAGKIMLYNSTNGHRVKNGGTAAITWVHTACNIQQFNLQQCLFGGHLLKLTDVSTPVCIVESEKTAVIASVYLPQFVWLATGGCNNLSEKLWRNSLIRRRVVLFPDLDKATKWNDIMILKMRPAGIDVSISRFAEGIANEAERQSGCDIADFLIKYKPSELPVNWMAYFSNLVGGAIKHPSSNQNAIVGQNSGQICHIAADGKLYIPNGSGYTVRDSVEAYNNRAGNIEFVGWNAVDTSTCRTCTIDLITLTINN